MVFSTITLPILTPTSPPTNPNPIPHLPLPITVPDSNHQHENYSRVVYHMLLLIVLLWELIIYQLITLCYPTSTQLRYYTRPIHLSKRGNWIDGIVTKKVVNIKVVTMVTIMVEIMGKLLVKMSPIITIPSLRQVEARTSCTMVMHICPMSKQCWHRY